MKDLFVVLALVSIFSAMCGSADAEDSYDPKIPWKAFGNAEPAPKDISVQEVDAYFVAPYGDDANPGTLGKPWKDVVKAAARLHPGDALYLREGRYEVTERIRISGKNPGKTGKWITVSSYMDEKAVIDGRKYDKTDLADGFSGDHGGLLDIVSSGNIRIRNLRVENAHLRGISVTNSNNVEIIGNEIHNTYACGIAVWDNTWPPSEKKNAYRGFKILGNKVTKANTYDMLPALINRKDVNEPPHEAISIAGATDFEVAFNVVQNCDKEGIDVKENSRNGSVHHNSVNGNARQGLYADAWFGSLRDVSFYNNIVYNNRGAGLALSVEGEDSYLKNVTFANNLVYNNYGPGMYISRWGNDLLRENITVSLNTFVHNGYGGGSGSSNFWINGGLLFHSGNVRNMKVTGNIFSDSDNFETGFDTKAYGDSVEGIKATLRKKNIIIENNLFNYTDKTRFPYTVPYTGPVLQYFGDSALMAKPQFRNPAQRDYRLVEGSDQRGYGAF